MRLLALLSISLRSKHVVLLALCIIGLDANASVEGWKMEVSGHEQHWSKTFSKGELHVYASEWQKLGKVSVKDWLKNHRMVTRKGDGVNGSKLTIKKSRVKNGYYVMRILNARNKEKRISVLTACGARNRVRLVEVIGPQSLFSKTQRRAVTESARITLEACQQDTVASIKTQDYLENAEAPLNPNANQRNTSKIPSPLKSAKTPRGLKELRGVVTYGIQPGGMFGPISDVVALFEDGTYSTDLKRLFAQGMAASKAAKPERWGHWRIRNGELELKAAGSKEYQTTSGNWIARQGGTDLRLKGCFGNITSTSSSPYGGSTTVGNASSWCFQSDGRFAHSSTGFATASGGVQGAASSSKRNSGRYRIDGYAAHFIYDDGKEIVTAFCFLDDKKSHIAINGKRYMGRK